MPTWLLWRAQEGRGSAGWSHGVGRTCDVRSSPESGRQWPVPVCRRQRRGRCQSRLLDDCDWWVSLLFLKKKFPNLMEISTIRIIGSDLLLIVVLQLCLPLVVNLSNSIWLGLLVCCCFRKMPFKCFIWFIVVVFFTIISPWTCFYIAQQLSNVLLLVVRREGLYSLSL